MGRHRPTTTTTTATEPATSQKPSFNSSPLDRQAFGFAIAEWLKGNCPEYLQLVQYNTVTHKGRPAVYDKDHLANITASSFAKGTFYKPYVYEVPKGHELTGISNLSDIESSDSSDDGEAPTLEGADGSKTPSKKAARDKKRKLARIMRGADIH